VTVILSAAKDLLTFKSLWVQSDVSPALNTTGAGVVALYPTAHTFVIQKVDIGVRYQSGEKDGGSMSMKPFYFPLKMPDFSSLFNYGPFFAYMRAKDERIMKKISLIAFIIVTSLQVMAQYKPKIGIKAGLNVSTLTNNSGLSSKAGLHAGLLAHIHIDPQWSLQPELVYSNQGAKYTISDGEHNLNLNYINIPLLLQYNFDNGFRLQTGPQIGFLVNANDKLGGSSTGNVSTSDFKTVDAAWSFGASYLTYSGFGIDARYNAGLSNVNKFGTINEKNSVFQFGLFYLVDHHHKSHSR
jgi:hypothetical protein